MHDVALSEAEGTKGAWSKKGKSERSLDPKKRQQLNGVCQSWGLPGFVKKCPSLKLAPFTGFINFHAGQVQNEVYGFV